MQSYSTVGDGTLISHADASINHPLSTKSFTQILAEFDLSTTKPSPLFTSTPSSVKDKEGPLSDGDTSAKLLSTVSMKINGTDSFLDAHLATVKELEFGMPSPNHLDDLSIFAEFFNNETAAPPTSLIATTVLEFNLPAEDLPWSTWGAAAEVLRTCVASVVQNLCTQECRDMLLVQGS